MPKKKVNDLPKMPRGQGSFFYHREKIGYRRTFTFPSGRKEKKTVYGDTIDECLLKMKKAERDVEAEVISSKDILYDAISKWMDNVKKNRLKPQSYVRYKESIEHQIKDSNIGHLQYQKITTEELQRFIDSLNEENYSYSTIQKCYNLLRAFYRYSCAIDRFSNPMTIVVLPLRYNIKKDTKEVAWFSDDDIEKFIKEATRRNSKTHNYVYRNGYMFAANIYLGLRVGELCALQWKDFDFENNFIKITKTVVQYKNPFYDPSNPESKKNILKVQENTKTNHNRYVPMNSKAKAYILKHLELHPYESLDDYVVCSCNHKLLFRHQINDPIKHIQRKSGTSVQGAASHTLRHTCASLYFKAGIPIEIIAKILGHSPDTCRKIYIGLVEEQLQQAATQMIPIIEI